MKSEQLRILMFAPFCYPQQANAEALVTAKLLIAATDAGWKIDVIAQAGPEQFSSRSINGMWEPLTGIVRNIDGVRKLGVFMGMKHWHALQSLKKIESIFWVSRAFLKARRLISMGEYDVILSRVVPVYGHMPAFMLSRRVDLPWLANWSDPMPCQKHPPPYGRGSSAPIPFYLHNYFTAVVRKAHWHTFPCERLRKYVCSYFPECEEKSSVIPHVALGRIRNCSPQKQRGFSLCYSGGLGFRKLDAFLEGIKRFLQATKIDKPFSVKLVGDELLVLRETVRKLGLEEVISLKGKKTYEETQEIVAASSVLVVIEAATDEGIYLPSKFVDYVQTGRPVLAVSPPVGTLNDVFTAYGGGIASDCNCPDTIAQAITTLYAEWKAETLDKNYGSYRLFDLFSKDRVVEQYTEIFWRIRQKQR